MSAGPSDGGDDPFGDDDEDMSWMEEAADKAEEEINKCSKCPEASEEVLSSLRRHFGHPGFRGRQWEIVRGVMDERRDQCVVMATGYGKSLCYQARFHATHT